MLIDHQPLLKALLPLRCSDVRKVLKQIGVNTACGWVKGRQEDLAGTNTISHGGLKMRGIKYLGHGVSGELAWGGGMDDIALALDIQ